MKKIGILTFHWATNYGAVLQSYALQEALKKLGYDVQIINYKPKKFDDSLWHFVRYRKFLNISEYLREHNKEHKLAKFRDVYLNVTKRYRSIIQLQTEHLNYDILITGSDQILNPSFLESGENGGSTAYFLDFGNDNVKIVAYAASFGTTYYPEHLIQKCSKYVNKFNLISSRELSGIDIFSKMGGDDVSLRPDPTLLHKSDFYYRLLDKQEPVPFTIRMYMLRGREKSLTKQIQKEVGEIISDPSIEGWLNAVNYSSHFITNSFHGMVFCLLFHVPFSIVLNSIENTGMNDRFFTLLQEIGLEKRIFSEANFSIKDLDYQFDWEQVDTKICEIRDRGWSFIKQIATC